jgi:urea transport system ATP-binding protein
VTGKTRPDHGSAWFAEDVDLLTLSEPEIAQAGIGRKFQKPTVFESLTVFENLDRSSGSRSACCSCRSRTCCWWTNRSPA